VRRAARQCKLDAGVIPDYVRLRQMSVRAYDAAHLMVDAAYIHLHNAKRGCFSCRVDRA
jgi:hypothetical protein